VLTLTSTWPEDARITQHYRFGSLCAEPDAMPVAGVPEADAGGPVDAQVRVGPPVDAPGRQLRHREAGASLLSLCISTAPYHRSRSQSTLLPHAAAIFITASRQEACIIACLATDVCMRSQ